MYKHNAWQWPRVRGPSGEPPIYSIWVTAYAVDPRGPRPEVDIAGAQANLAAILDPAQPLVDRYGHLVPGSGAEARALLDAYLEREDG